MGGFFLGVDAPYFVDMTKKVIDHNLCGVYREDAQ